MVDTSVSIDEETSQLKEEIKRLTAENNNLKRLVDRSSNTNNNDDDSLFSFHDEKTRNKNDGAADIKSFIDQESFDIDDEDDEDDEEIPKDKRIHSVLTLYRSNDSDNMIHLMSRVIDCTATLFYTLTSQKHFNISSASDIYQNAMNKAHANVFTGILNIFNDVYTENITKSKLSFPFIWLFQSYPIASKTNNDNAFMKHILHWYLAYSDPNIDDCELLFNQTYIDRSSNEDISPLTIGVAKSIPNIDIIGKVISLPFKLCEKVDFDGSIPLMHAAAYNKKTAVVDLLYTAYSDGIYKSDMLGLKAINYACYSGNIDACKYLISKDPDSISNTSTTGLTTLHDCAVNTSGGGIELVQYIYDLHPSSIKSKDAYGALPLHLAAEFNTLEVVMFLYNCNKQAICIADNEGMLPMHYASKRHNSIDVSVLDWLVSQNPQGRVAVDDSSNSVAPLKAFSPLNYMKETSKYIADTGIKLLDEFNNSAKYTTSPMQVEPVLSSSAAAAESAPDAVAATVTATADLPKRSRRASYHTRHEIAGTNSNRMDF